MIPNPHRQMTGRERILASLRGQTVDHLCWSPLVDEYFTRSLPAQGYPAYTVAEAVRLIGGDIMARHCPSVQLSADDCVKRTLTRIGNILIETMETPVGTLRMEKVLDQSITGAITKHCIKTLDDIKVYRFMLEHSAYRQNYTAHVRWSDEIGEDGIATLEGPATPIQVFIQELCGIENTFYLLHDHTKVVETCFEIMHELNMQAYRLIAEGPGEVVIDYEDTSTTTLSPEMYTKYCASEIDDYAKVCQSGGKIFLTHMCGKLSGFREQLRAGAQDGIDSVCPPTTGDLWADEARLAWGEGKVIIGGIEPPRLERMTAAETNVYVTEVLSRMPTFSRFILSTGDATAYGTPVENLQTIADIARQTK